MSIFDNHTSQESIEDFTKELKWQERLRTLVGFETSDGKRHLGYYDPIVNPCGDYREPNSVVERYIDEYGNEYCNVKLEFPVEAADFYYWDAEKDDYQLLVAPQKDNSDNSLKITSQAYQEWLIKDIKGTEITFFRMIREWLVLNAKCPSPVFMDKDYVIHCDSEIEINPDAIQHIPDYIKIANTK